MGRSWMYHSSGSLVANATSTRSGNTLGRCDIGFLVGYSSKSEAYRVFNHATGLVEETYDVEFDESNGFQGAHENLDDVGDEPLREAMTNISVGDIKPKDDV